MATMAELLNNPALYLGLGLLSSGARRPETAPDPLASNMANMIGQYQQAQQMQAQTRVQQAQQERLAQQAQQEQERWMEEQGRLKQAEEQQLVAREAVQNVLRQNPNAAPGDITRALLQATGDPSYLGQMTKEQRALMLNAGGGVAVLPPGATEPTFYEAPGGAAAQGRAPQVREFKTPQGISTRQMTPTGSWQEVEFAPYGAREGAVAATQQAPDADVKLRESEAKATTFYSQMRGAREVLGTLKGEGFNPESTKTQVGIMAAGNPATNVLAGEKAQRARQAQEQWAEAYLRFKTGAATNADEIRRNVRTFFPQLGDKAETIKQKAEARKRAEEDIALSAGKGAEQVRARPAGEVQPAGAQPAVRTPREAAASSVTQEDIEFTARKHGVSVEEVKRRLGIR